MADAKHRAASAPVLVPGYAARACAASWLRRRRQPHHPPNMRGLLIPDRPISLILSRPLSHATAVCAASLNRIGLNSV
jgi:hypothetical protein